jgi:D-beta-D-heptose 7-phosphate kinase / D-beta-D-heptose 1-phosphate adenosyltransferase
VYDVTGAGDTVVAVLALGLAAGFPLSEAAAMSNEAAGLVIQLPGTAVVTLEELIERGDGR